MAGEEPTTSVFDQLRGGLDNIPAPVKLGAVVLVGLLLLWMIWNFVAGMLMQWEPLAIQVQGAEKSQILEYIRSENIKYKIEGDTILVPADQASELRIELLGQGMSATPLMGLERLNEVTMGDTEKTIAAKRQLAFEEEIKRNLLMLKSIKNAEVNLSLPSDSAFFSRSQVPAKASITIHENPSNPIGKDRVRGIQLAVANSVQGLVPENVVIINQDGKQLSEENSEESRYNAKQIEEERRIIEAVENIFVPVLGPERVQVSANVEIDRTSEVVTDKKIDINSPATTSSRTVEKDEERPTLGGQPGSESNTGDPNAANANALATSTSTEETVQTEFPETITQREKPAGTIKRKSVAVIIDLKEESTAAEDGSQQTQWVNWSDETLENWRDAIRQAAGILENRGDEVSLMQISFEEYHRRQLDIREQQISVQQRRMFDIFDWGDWTALIKIPLLIIILFSLFWFIIRPVGTLVLEPILSLPSQSEAEIPEELPKTVEELEAEIEGKIEDEIDMASKEVTKGTILKKRVSELAKNEPEGFTQLIRTWMNE